VLLRLDLLVGKVAFRFSAPDTALSMPWHELKYWYNWIVEVEKHEKEEMRKARGK
jgi:hypothetical protein